MKSKMIFKKSKLMLGLAVLPALFSNALHADITLNGFASIRGTSVSSDGGMEPFPGFEEGEITFNSESLFALQAQADLGEGLTATVQLFGEGKTDFDVEARWAYVSYQINDTHRVSGGRFANPLFHQSEYEKVGFAHNFARLPKAVYIDFEFSTIEGIALDSQYNIGDYNLTTKVLYGGWDGEAFSAVTNNFVDFGLNNIFSANATLAGDWWQIFSGLMAAEIEGEGIDSSTVFPLATKGINAALATGATNAQVSDFKSKLGWHTKDALYWFSGFAIDRNNWLLDFEFVDYVVKDSTDAANQSWYLAFGRRFDEFLVTLHTEDYSQEADYAFLNGVDHPALLATGKGIKDAFAQREFDGVGLAVRYDFHPSAALKVDYFTGTDTRATVGDYQIWSIGIDLVF